MDKIIDNSVKEFLAQVSKIKEGGYSMDVVECAEAHSRVVSNTISLAQQIDSELTKALA